MVKRIFVILMILVTILSFAAKLTILHINDTHGHAWAFSETNNPNIGGFAAIATIVEEVRKEVESQGGHVLFLHAGDINTGVPESDQLDAAPDILALNLMKLDATTFGNHEFDKPKSILAKQIAIAKFPFVSANFSDPEGVVKTKAYVVKDFGDLKVAIFGLTTEETAILEPIYLNGATFSDAVQASKSLLPELRAKADVVIALTHLGWEPEGEGKTTSKQLAQLVNGIDVIIDGHSHTKFENAQFVNNTIIAQAWEWGKYVGRLDLDIENGKIVSWSWKPIPVNLKIYKGKDADGKDTYEFVGKPYEENFYVKTVLDYFKSIGSEKLNTVIGETKILLDGERANVRSKSTNLANMICDSMMWKVNADLALTNGGGIRASIKPGKITIRDVLTVLPFGNTLYVIKMTGSQLLEVLQYAATIKEGQGAFLQTGGLIWKSVDGKVVEAKIKGQPLESDKLYTVVTNDYMAQGGDGYTMLKGLPGYNTGFTMDSVLSQYIQEVLNGIVQDYDSQLRYVRQ
ncbi:MAG TPA: bifunctional UDP-sugar hydrolase/5'-nucleotidase [Pseudothermotoga sp.]|nr:bifunctional UDP-sugar hydrolase/5'-nucleotidase [Pseudothermotoga sp.]HOK83706.1 bifunctional UDP-sugar hydrolase/5'-nucleotidase [Pseudothermotoga sp.]HPP69345.1 bifunctional UDP-sugar hydrolase/5'-nucleotidase [Pseudothermotoga sp.]